MAQVAIVVAFLGLLLAIIGFPYFD